MPPFSLTLLCPEPLAKFIDAFAWPLFLLVFLSLMVFAHRLKALSASNFSRTAASTPEQHVIQHIVPLTKAVKETGKLRPEYLNARDPGHVIAVAGGLRACFEKIKTTILVVVCSWCLKRRTVGRVQSTRLFCFLLGL